MSYRTEDNPVSVRVFEVEHKGKPKNLLPPTVSGKELSEFVHSRCSNSDTVENSDKTSVDNTELEEELIIESACSENSKKSNLQERSATKCCWTEETLDNFVGSGDISYSNSESLSTPEVQKLEPNMSVMMENKSFQDLDRRFTVHLQVKVKTTTLTKKFSIRNRSQFSNKTETIFFGDL